MKRLTCFCDPLIKKISCPNRTASSGKIHPVDVKAACAPLDRYLLFLCHIQRGTKCSAHVVIKERSFFVSIPPLLFQPLSSLVNVPLWLPHGALTSK